MGTTRIIMIGYLPAKSDYRDAGNILRTLTSVAEHGYCIATDEEALQCLASGCTQEAGISPALSLTARGLCLWQSAVSRHPGIRRWRQPSPPGVQLWLPVAERRR